MGSYTWHREAEDYESERSNEGGIQMKKGIEYADKSWNPFTGCLMDGCAVGKNCWAYKMSQRHKGRFGYDADNPFKPTPHADKLDVPLNRKKPTRWDTCFMGDIAYAETEWLKEIMIVVRQCPQHRFYFLTKRPDLLAEKNIIFPENVWVGVTVNSQRDVLRIINLRKIQACHRWVSFEPLYGEVIIGLHEIDWIVIGAQSNPEKQPNIGWVVDLMDIATDRNIPIFCKPNLTVVASKYIMELPKELGGF